MKIVQIFPGKIWGGAEQYILDLSHQLAAQGHQVVFIGYTAPAVMARLKDEPFETHHLPMKWPFDRKSVKAIAEIIADADVVHIHDTKFVPPVSKAKSMSGSDVRIVLTRHIARASRTLPWRRRHFRKLHRMIFVSDLGCRLWSSVNPWMPAELKTTIHNSIPEQKTAASVSLRDKYAIGLTTPLIVFTGRVRRSKGCECIVRALARIKDRDFHMVFIGACKPKDYALKLKALAQELDIADRVHFYGFTSEARALIKEADIALAPSIVREACPLSPMEYMQEGIPVIATDNGAQPEYITDGVTGLLIPPSDVNALAEKTALLIDNPDLRKEIGDNAKKYFHNHLAFSAFINKVLNVYH